MIEKNFRHELIFIQRLLILGKMNKFISVVSAFAVSGFSFLLTSAQAENLYRSGAGLYGGNSYQDSSGKYYDDDPLYGPKGGLYGGGVIVDQDGKQYDCDTSGYCTPF